MPVTGDFWPVFHRYLAEERGNLPTDAAWVGHRRGAGKPLRYSAFEAALRYLANRLGIQVTAHMFRHTVATTLLFNGCPIGHIKEILGHDRLITTCNFYLGVDKRAAKKAHGKISVQKNKWTENKAQRNNCASKYGIAG